MTNLLEILTSVSNENLATVQSASWSIRSAGVALGLVLSSMIFQTVFRQHLRGTLGDDFKNQLSGLIAIATPEFSALPTSTKETVLDAYEEATHFVFYSLLAQATIATIASVFVKDNIVKHIAFDNQHQSMYELNSTSGEDE